MDGFHHAGPGLRLTVADACPTAANVPEYQHGHRPMFLDTVCVKTKLKFSVPRAGREIPSIFCSTSGPTRVFVVVPALIDCQGQPNLRCGRFTLTPKRCKAADSAASTAHATARRKKRPASTARAAHFAQRGTSGRRGQRRRLRGCSGWYRAGSVSGSVRSSSRVGANAAGR